jgi:hypothetical protein
MTLPPDWIWLAVAALGGWFAKDGWPWLRGLLDAEFKERRKRETEAAKAVAARRSSDREVDAGRYLAAFETSAAAQQLSAAAQKETAEALGKVAAAIDMFGRASIAQQFTTQEMRRELHDGFERLERMIGQRTTEAAR